MEAAPGELNALADQLYSITDSHHYDQPRYQPQDEPTHPADVSAYRLRRQFGTEKGETVSVPSIGYRRTGPSRVSSLAMLNTVAVVFSSSRGRKPIMGQEQQPAFLRTGGVHRTRASRPGPCGLMNLRMSDPVHQADTLGRKAAGQYRIGSRIC